ncbi:MAG: hypothetical protein J5382_02400 [Bacteroidales bacterium]|nr:hypothetical protein [Bacteroidales bacterium]
MSKMLFPHWVQRVSLAVFILDYIAMMVFVFRSVYNDMATSKALELGLLIVLFISIFCCVFSREKREDEYISKMRLQSVAIVAAIAFLVAIVMNIINLAILYDGPDDMEVYNIRMFRNGNFIIQMAILYFIIFKIKIRK